MRSVYGCARLCPPVRVWRFVLLLPVWASRASVVPSAGNPLLTPPQPETRGEQDRARGPAAPLPTSLGAGPFPEERATLFLLTRFHAQSCCSGERAPAVVPPARGTSQGSPNPEPLVTPQNPLGQSLELQALVCTKATHSRGKDAEQIYRIYIKP